MRKRMGVIVFLSAFVVQVFAQDAELPRFEIGIIAGSPSGLSVKYWVAPRSAIDAGGGWSFDEDRLELFADYQFHYLLFGLERGTLPLYFGLGGALQITDDESFLGIRVPLGGSYIFQGPPISLFVEVAPIMEFIPETEFDWAAGVGIRLALGSVPFVD